MSRIFNRKNKKNVIQDSEVVANSNEQQYDQEDGQYYQEDDQYYQDDNLNYDNENQYYDDQYYQDNNQNAVDNYDENYDNRIGSPTYDNAVYMDETNQPVETNQYDQNASRDSYDYSSGSLKPRFLNGKVYLENKEEIPTNTSTESEIFDTTFKKNTSNIIDLTTEDNSKLLYKIRDLGVSDIKYNKRYINMELHKINVDIRSEDRIVVLSDQRNYDSLFIDLLKNNVKKTEGNILVLKKKNAIWLDTYDEKGFGLSNRDADVNTLEDINYNSISSFKNSLINILNKIIAHFLLDVNNKTITKLLDEFFLTPKMNKSYNDLTVYERYRFIFLCDIIMNKRIICVSYISIDLTIKEKIDFFRFLNEYLVGKDIVLIITTTDITELKFLCNKIILISNNTIKDEKYFKDILKHYESIDDYVALNLK